MRGNKPSPSSDQNILWDIDSTVWQRSFRVRVRDSFRYSCHGVSGLEKPESINF